MTIVERALEPRLLAVRASAFPMIRVYFVFLAIHLLRQYKPSPVAVPEKLANRRNHQTPLLSCVH